VSAADEGTAANGDLPRIDFATFVLSLSHSALVHLGDAPDPGGAPLSPDLELARQTIDLLALLEEKTRGNLSGDEERILSVSISDLKIRLSEVSKSK